MSTELDQISTAVAEINKVEAGLSHLRETYGGVIFEVSTTAGMEAAREARRAVKEPRLEVERIRKAAKAPILALGKRLDSEAARITAELEKIEAPIHDQIVAEERRKEAERQARIDAELARVARIHERIAYLRGNPSLTPTSGSALIAEHIADLDGMDADEGFDEFAQQAHDAKAGGLKRLTDLHAAALAHEAEQERIKAERAELARLRAEQEERDRVAREAQAKADAEAKAERERLAEEQRQANAAEAGRLAAERAENERIARERREQLDREEVKDKERQRLEDERLAKERADIARQEEELRKAREPKARAKKAPTSAEMIAVLAAHYGVKMEVAEKWLRSIQWEQAA